MRTFIFAAALTLAACAAPSGPVTISTLGAADAATSLAVGDRISWETSARQAAEGMDPVVNVTLRHADGRTLSFQEANHAPNDLVAQGAGGALAQIMGVGEAETTLYYATETARAGAPFFCGPQGPAAIGTYRAPDGAVQLVGLRQAIEFETRPDGVLEAIPYSPDQVCARLRFRVG
jgi:hypothetical protein